MVGSIPVCDCVTLEIMVSIFNCLPLNNPSFIHGAVYALTGKTIITIHIPILQLRKARLINVSPWLRPGFEPPKQVFVTGCKWVVSVLTFALLFS